MAPNFSHKGKHRLAQSLLRMGHRSDQFPMGTAQSFVNLSLSSVLAELTEMHSKSMDGMKVQRDDARYSDHLHVCHVAFCFALSIMKQTQLKEAGRLGTMEGRFKEIRTTKRYQPPK